MKVIEGVMLCAGFFLMASDQIPVVLAGIGLLALAGYLGKAYRGHHHEERGLPDFRMDEPREKKRRA